MFSQFFLTMKDNILVSNYSLQAQRWWGETQYLQNEYIDT